MKIGQVQYSPLARIGVGQSGNSEVWRIDEPQLGGMMVAKEIAKSKFPNPSEYFDEAHRVFESAHPNVVAIQYAFQTTDRVCLIMPFFAQGSLAERIANGPLSEKETIRVGIGVLSGVAHIHGCGLIHFDLKPSNVLFSLTGEPLVADFGQSRAYGSMGTVKVPPLNPDTYPPEAYRYATGSAQTDIFHMGLLLYRAVNGEPFFARQLPADEHAHQQLTVRGKYPDRTRFMPHVSARMKTLIRKALKVDPEERFQTATEMRRALGRVDLKLDWDVRVNGDVTTWRAKREQQPELVVRLEKDCSTTFSVSVYTQNGSKLRAKEPNRLAAVGLKEREVLKHLSGTVFPALAE